MTISRYFKHLAVAAAFAGAALAGPNAHADGTRLVLAKISSNAVKQLPRLNAMAEALSVALKPHGVSAVEVRVVADIAAAERAMRAGEIDMLSETVFGALELERAGAGEIALAEWKSGKKQYHTVFFARKDAAPGLNGLRGNIVAFQDEGSTSGHHLPAYTLVENGFSLVADGTPGEKDAVRYMFAGEDEINVVVAVARGQASAGTLSNLDWQDENGVPPALRDKLTIIHETKPILRSVTVLRKDMDPVVRGHLVKTLEAMGDDPAAQGTLKKYFKVKKFERIGPEEEALLSGARSMVRAQS
jgi:phosphonate transport system substrate-binding protein